MRVQKRFCSLCGGKLERISHDGRRWPNQRVTFGFGHRMRLYCKKCDKIQYENPLPAAAAVVLDAGGGLTKGSPSALASGNRLLLVKRGMEPEKGAWCLPGGFVELDETPAEGAVRELAEETGVQGEVEQLIDCVYEDSPLYGPLIIIGYRLSSRGGVLRAGDDAAEVKYFPIDDLPRIAFASHQAIIDKIARRR